MELCSGSMYARHGINISHLVQILYVIRYFVLLKLLHTDVPLPHATNFAMEKLRESIKIYKKMFLFLCFKEGVR